MKAMVSRLIADAMLWLDSPAADPWLIGLVAGAIFAFLFTLPIVHCAMGWHDIYSLADSPATMVLPAAGDSVDEIIRKFRETTKIRCRHCSYTYEGGR